MGQSGASQVPRPAENGRRLKWNLGTTRSASENPLTAGGHEDGHIPSATWPRIWQITRRRSSRTNYRNQSCAREEWHRWSAPVPRTTSTSLLAHLFPSPISTGSFAVSGCRECPASRYRPKAATRGSSGSIGDTVENSAPYSPPPQMPTLHLPVAGRARASRAP